MEHCFLSVDRPGVFKLFACLLVFQWHHPVYPRLASHSDSPVSVVSQVLGFQVHMLPPHPVYIPDFEGRNPRETLEWLIRYNFPEEGTVFSLRSPIWQPLAPCEMELA